MVSWYEPEAKSVGRRGDSFREEIFGAFGVDVVESCYSNFSAFNCPEIRPY